MGQTPKMKKGSLIAVDSMIFIYLFELDVRYKNKLVPLFKDIEKGSFQAITSVISLLESLSSPALTKERLNVFKRFFYETPNLKTVGVDSEIAVTAARLRAENQSLRTPDSIQMATARTFAGNYFLTNDLKLKKVKIKGLKIITPTDL